MPYEDTDWTTADDTAKETSQHFFTDTGGAHVADDSGAQATVSSNGLDLTDSGGTTTAYFHADGAQVGADNASHVKVEQAAIGMWAQWMSYNIWTLVKVLNIYFNGTYVHVDAPVSGLWLGAATGNAVLAAAEGDSTGEVVLRGGNMTVRDQDGTQLWKGTAQQMADALTHASNQTGYTYGGSVVKTVTASREITVFSNAEVRSLFNVASGKENQIGVSIMNGDYGAQAHRVTSVNYRSSSGWNMYLDGNASAGAFRINYIVHVPADCSTL